MCAALMVSKRRKRVSVVTGQGKDVESSSKAIVIPGEFSFEIAEGLVVKTDVEEDEINGQSFNCR